MRLALTTIALISFQHLCFFTVTEANIAGGKIKLRLYKTSSTDYEETLIEEGEMLFHERNGYNQTQPLILLIHGMATGADCYFVNGLIDAFNKREISNDYNIFAVDMPELFENSARNDFYIGVLGNVEPAGQMIGELFKKVIRLDLTSPEKINIVGYSMGAQVAGYAARIVKNSFSEINFIAGLDPAGPGFHMMLGRVPAALVHVSKNDAKITHFYHTNSVSCGTRDRVATADFIFNKGTIQPGCTKDAKLECSHVRVPFLYIESVTNPKSFVARKCSSWEEFRSCNCNKHDTVFITFPPDLRAKGIYHLRTRATSPFALGKRGGRCRKIVHSENLENAEHQDGRLHTKTRKYKSFKEILHPEHKPKSNIHLNKNKMQKVEDLVTKQNFYEQLKSLTEKEAIKINGIEDNFDDKNLHFPSKTEIVGKEDLEYLDSNQQQD